MSQPELSESERYTQVPETQPASPAPAPKSQYPDILNQEDEKPLTPAKQDDVAQKEVPAATRLGWHPQVPLPSELIESYRPPGQLFTETMPVADWGQDHSSSENSSPGASGAPARDSNFAIRANEMINEVLGRTPGGTSVVEPESVLGESGRLYHGYKDGKYFLPNDAAEQDRLDMQHHLWSLLLDGWLALAPMEKLPRYVLDIGTGTGIWATEFAEQNPSSYVIGTDLSAIQPPPQVSNIHFTKDDAEEDWVFPLPASQRSTELDQESPGSDEQWIRFDYIHLRLMFSCFTYPHVVLKHAYDNLNPGGWIEFQETALDVFQANPDFHGDAMIRWTEGCKRGAAAAGRDISVAKRYKSWLQEAGFVDVTEKKIFIPMSPWPKDRRFREIGKWQLQNLLEGVRGVGWKMLSAAGMKPEEIEALVADVHSEIRMRANHSYGYVYVIYGRKPLPVKVETPAATA